MFRFLDFANSLVAAAASRLRKSRRAAGQAARLLTQCPGENVNMVTKIIVTAKATSLRNVEGWKIWQYSVANVRA